MSTTGFKVQIKSRHPSHDLLRENIRMPFRSVLRLGSQTVMTDSHTKNGTRIECNTVDAVRRSADKYAMKEAFTTKGVITADWFIMENDKFKKAVALEDGITFKAVTPEYPLIVKPRFGSRGSGIALLKSAADLTAWKRGKTMTEYIFETFHNYTREYRLHVTEQGVFYTNRKMLKSDTPDNKRFYRNDSNSTWILEENPEFNKPINWNAIVAESVKALKAVGLDIGAVDVKVQSTTTENGKKRKEQKFFIIEINSAPSFGTRTGQEYLKKIPEVLKLKAAKNKKVNA